MKASMTVQKEIVGRPAGGKKTWLPALLIGTLIVAVPATLNARDRGFNQPGAAGNVGHDPGVNQPGAAGNVGRDPGVNHPGAAGNRRARPYR